ncbi:hypothetical protein BKA65DRAFT_496084 [Rhexocercosporidium sp. MPI-PUGE-AT-0058]|nr:hypothetical protein BKA65DRAFT_496084 [Rhexocercosporidium sp. MPI-PUGE-AT-0058]
MASRKLILTISASLHLAGHPISSILSKQWSLAPPELSSRFENIGYQVDPTDPNTVSGLRKVIKERQWDGIIFGWCIRGHVEFTELFEKLVQVAFKELIKNRNGRVEGNEVKVMFCEGPGGLVKAVARNFPGGL